MKRLALIALAVVGAVAANAQVNYSSNFDPGAYAPGLLSGQDGWVDGSGNSNLPAVQNGVSFSSTQSVKLIGDNGLSSTFTTTAHPFAAGLPSANTMILTASAMLRVDSIGNDRYFGIAFGGTNATSGRLGIALGGTGLRGGGGTYSSYNNFANGLLQARTTADFLGRWIRMSVTADRSSTTNNLTFTFSGLGTSGGAAIESFTTSGDLTGVNITHVQVVSDWSNSGIDTGVAYLDDVSFGANPVPEPATMAVLGLGIAALIRRRKRA